jgi:limonene-1,2-epoxide hydrolase
MEMKMPEILDGPLAGAALMQPAIAAAADALGEAIHARSYEQVLAIYSDDIVVWHGSTGQSMGKVENAALLADIFKLTSHLEYINIKRHAIEGSLVQQHRLIGKFADGTELPPLEACLVMTVRKGLIVRIDQYFDGSVYQEVWARLAELRQSTTTS